jgi:Flp pilus assembly protein TadG
MRFHVNNERGFALVYMAGMLTVLSLFVGLAVDSGRGYIVKAQLTKAVDGAALGAARMLNSGDPKGEATRIFKQNFPLGYMGTDPGVDPTGAADFFDLQTNAATGQNIVTVKATTVMATTFMRLANLNTVTVRAQGQATRRMVDLSLVLDVSSSIGSKWNAVRDATRAFVEAFDQNHDRFALTLFSNGARVLDQMPASRGFDKVKVKADVPNSLPGGSTLMVEGLWRGWDELRTVPNGQQSGLRVIVLFTDGASNGVPAFWDGSGLAKAMRTADFPDNGADPDNQTHANPPISGMSHTETGAASPGWAGEARPAPYAGNNWLTSNAHSQMATMPNRTAHTHGRSVGIPNNFPLFTNTLKVNGVNQDVWRPLRNPVGAKYKAEVYNINNAARNVLEIIANAARSDAAGDYPIRIYTIGMGALVQYNLGTREETSESILKRVANDKTSPDFNSAQLEGKYFFAATEADVSNAFQQLLNQIIRLTK